MLASITQYLDGMPNEGVRTAVAVPLKEIADTISSQTNVSAALRISGGASSPLVQTNATSYGIAMGKLWTIASATNLPALVGTIVNGQYNIFMLTIDSTGTQKTVLGAPGATLAQVGFPPGVIIGVAVLGYVIIHPTGTGNFVGGTTNLDDATVVPNAVFINTLGPFDPTILP